MAHGHSTRTPRESFHPTSNVTGRLVTYARVSTTKQGAAGLGLEAQQAAITSYLSGAKPIGQFIEVESGRKNDRAELMKALALCRKEKATLIIAKLDRLSRNLAFISNLMESKVEFVVCDFPQANRLTLHILAAVAQHEVEMIRTRTKAAMQAAKAKGVKFGNPMLDNSLNAKQRTEANEFALKLAPMLQTLKDSGMTLDEMCQSLTRSNVPTPQGGMWSRKQLSRIFHRLEECEAA